MKMLTQKEAAEALKLYGRALDLMRDCAELILNDQCPPRQERHLCQVSVDFWDGICNICWLRYMRWIEDTMTQEWRGRHEATPNGSRSHHRP